MRRFVYIEDSEWDDIMANASSWKSLSELDENTQVMITWPEAQELDGASGIGEYFWAVLDSDEPAFICDKIWYEG